MIKNIIRFKVHFGVGRHHRGPTKNLICDVGVVKVVLVGVFEVSYFGIATDINFGIRFKN